MTYAVLLMITLDTETLRFASADLREDGTFWEARILETGSIVRRINPLEPRVTLSEVAVTLNNSDGYFGELLQSVELRNCNATLYIARVSDSGAVSKTIVYTGLVTPKRIQGSSFTLQLRNVLAETIGMLQRPVSPDAFPNAPEGSMGNYQNIILGHCSAGKGAVICLIVDPSTRKVCIAQHHIDSADNFYKIKNDARSQIAVTVNATDSDGSGEDTATAIIDSPDWDADAKYICDSRGLVDDSGVWLSNVVEAVQQALIQFGGLSAADFDDDQWSAAAAGLNAKGFAAAGKAGAIIPGSAGELEKGEQQWNVLQEVLTGVGYSMIVLPNGRLGIKSVNISELSEAELVHYREEDGMLPEAPSIEFDAIEVQNSVKSRYGQSHYNEFEKYIQGDNSTSVSFYGSRESSFQNRVAQDDDVAGSELIRRMKLTSGKALTVNWTVNGFTALQDGSDIGDFVALSHGHAMGPWKEQQVFITARTVNFGLSETGMTPSVTLEGLPAGGAYTIGSIKLSQQVEEVLEMSADTWFNQQSPGTSYGQEVSMNHGIILFGSIPRRYQAVLASDLSTLPAGAVIQSAAVQLYCSSVFDTEFSMILRLCQCGKTDWIESGTFNDVDGQGNAWSNSFIGVQVSANQLATRGFITFALNSSGINMLQNAAGIGAAHFCFNTTNNDERAEFATRENSDVSRRPKLIITYTT